MSDPHFCPGCGTEQKPVPRYPWYFCKGCRDSATDGTGATLRFANTSMSGGFSVRRADAPPEATIECRSVICLIKGRPVFVTEARFGGTVAQPIRNPPASKEGSVDLRKGWPKTP